MSEPSKAARRAAENIIFTACAVDDAAEVIQHAIEAAVSAKQEQCAMVADDWAKSYAEDIFSAPEPRQHGKTVDQCSAAMGRHLCPAIANKIRALPQQPDEP